MATTVALQDILRPSVILGMFSRNRTQFLTVASLLGIAPDTVVGVDGDGGNVSLTTAAMEELPARAGSYDIFNAPKNGVNIVGPGSPAQIIAPNAVGSVQYRVARVNPSIMLHYDKMNNQRAIGGPATQLDRMGQAYVTKQAQYLTQVSLNTLEIMTLGMLQNSLYLIPDGAPDSYKLDFTSTGSAMQVDYRIPSGNISSAVPGLQMGTGANIIDAAWSNAATEILTHLTKISAAFVQQTGRPLRRVCLNGLMWNYVINNTQVRTAAGTASTPWAAFDWVSKVESDGETKAVRVAVLKAVPGVEWHINDETITVNGTEVKKFPDNYASFQTMTNDVIKLGSYAEPVVEQAGQAPVFKTGLATWHEYKSNPAAVQLFSLMNVIPMALVPSCLAWGKIA